MNFLNEQFSCYHKKRTEDELRLARERIRGHGKCGVQAARFSSVFKSCLQSRAVRHQSGIYREMRRGPVDDPLRRNTYRRLPAAIAPATSSTAASATTTSAAKATAAASAAIASATSAAATTRTAAALTRTGLVDADIAALEFGVVKFLDRPCGVIRVRHFDESKTARLS
jgi:hypothetical protein